MIDNTKEAGAPQPEGVETGLAVSALATGRRMIVGVRLTGNNKPPAPVASVVVGALTALHLGLAMMKSEESTFAPPADFPIDELLDAVDAIWHKAIHMLDPDEKEGESHA